METPNVLIFRDYRPRPANKRNTRVGKRMTDVGEAISSINHEYNAGFMQPDGKEAFLLLTLPHNLQHKVNV
jgi:hypothetical protein